MDKYKSVITVSGMYELEGINKKKSKDSNVKGSKDKAKYLNDLINVDNMDI